MENKNTIQKIFDSKIFWIVFSVVAALLFWTYVTSTEGDVREVEFRGIQVVFEGEDLLRESRDLVITDVDVSSVNVKISGSRSAISKLSASKIKAVVDVSETQLSGSTTSADMTYYYTLTYSGLSDSAYTLVESDPQVISFHVEKLSTKSVEVRGVFDGETAEGYAAEPVICEPSTIKISGPYSVISNVAYAQVVVEKEDVDSTVSYRSPFVLMDEDGNKVGNESITYDTDTVQVTLPVVSTKTVPLIVDFIWTAGATTENTKVKIEPESITIAGNADILDSYNSIVLGTIDTADFANSFEQTFTVVLNNELDNISGVTEAKVTVEIKGLETREFNVTNFSCINVGDGYTGTVINQSLTITVRASADVLDKIDPKYIRAVADLKDVNLTAGVVSVNAKIYIDGVENAGSIGDAKVYVSVSKS